MLGSNCLDTLDTLTFNAEMKVTTFFHEKKKITIDDSSTRVPSSSTTEYLEEEVTCLSTLLHYKDEELVQIQQRLEDQESENCRHQQQIKVFRTLATKTTIKNITS